MPYTPATGAVSFTGVGTCVVDANQAGNTDYQAATQVHQTIPVGQGSQTITFTSTPPSDATVGGPSYTPSATATSGLPVSFSIDASSTAGACSYTPATGAVSFTGVGTCAVDANQAGNTDYQAATQVHQTIPVGQGSQTITFTSTPPSDATVGGPSYTPSATATSGLPVSFSIDASSTAGACSYAPATGAVSFTGVGTCAVDAKQAGNTDYQGATQVSQSITIGTASLTITASSSAIAYEGPLPAITPIYSGFVNGDTASSLTLAPTCTTTATSSSPPGTYPSTCTGAAGANYSISYVAGTVTVSPATLTVTASSPAMAYGDLVPAITPIYSGFVNGDTALSLTLAPTCTTTATSSSPVGTYPSSCSGAVDADYAIRYTPGQVSIGAATLTVTATSTTMTYGGPVPTIMGIYSPATVPLSPPASCSTTATSSSPPGTYSSTCSGGAAANYAIGYAAGTVTVSPAPLSITATSTTMSYGGPLPAITPIYSGFVNGDTASSLTLAPTCTTAANSSSPPGTYSSTSAGAVDVDYAFSYTAGTVKVNAAPVPQATTTTTIPPAPPKGFPDAGLSYPDGAIVAYGGKDYVFAGGRAFAAAGSSLTAVEKVDHAQVVAAPAEATAPVTVAVRPGTLVSTKAVDGDGTLYVAGPDGLLHGFATPGQFFAGGYDAALVVSVPSLAGLQVASRSAGADGLTALSTRADGAVVDSSGTFYIFAGGRAFGLATPAELLAVEAVDAAQVLSGPVSSAQALAPIASGVLLSVAHGRGVFVSFEGGAYLFKAMGQFLRDGYGGTAAVPVPGPDHLVVVSPYSGS